MLRHCKEISTRELEADEITREVLTALRRSFITPLDRGDIKDLITSMDDAIDQMNKTAKVIKLFELNRFGMRIDKIDSPCQNPPLVISGASFIRLSKPISRGTATGQRNSRTRSRVSYHPNRTSEHSSVGAAKRRESVRMFG